MKKLSVAFVAAASIFALSASSASAAIVCNEDGDCWRTKTRYEYKPEFRVRVYDDDWRWEERDAEKYRWVESRDGRGYWSKGVWIEF
jgi:hypothetical protein